MFHEEGNALMHITHNAGCNQKDICDITERDVRYTSLNNITQYFRIRLEAFLITMKRFWFNMHTKYASTFAEQCLGRLSSVLIVWRLILENDSCSNSPYGYTNSAENYSKYELGLNLRDQDNNICTNMHAHNLSCPINVCIIAFF